MGRTGDHSSYNDSGWRRRRRIVLNVYILNGGTKITSKIWSSSLCLVLSRLLGDRTLTEGRVGNQNVKAKSSNFIIGHFWFSGSVKDPAYISQVDPASEFGLLLLLGLLFRGRHSSFFPHGSWIWIHIYILSVDPLACITWDQTKIGLNNISIIPYIQL